MPTESLGPFSVSHGDITTHDISQPNGEIKVTDAQIRWRGVDKTVKETQYNTNANQFTRTDDTSNNSWTTDSNGDSLEWVANIPSKPSGTFTEHTYDVDLKNEASSDSWIDEIVLWDHKYSDGWTRTNADESVFDISVSNDQYYKEYLTHSEQTNYSGGTCRFWIYTGQSVDVSLVFTVSTHSKETVTTTYHTQDPSVTRDVSGSYTGTLSDGEWSSWQPLNELTPNGNEEFYHNISGSGKAEFEFEYTWKYKYPNAVYQYRIYDESQNAIHKVALADPADSNLDYNHHRIAINGNVYALDVVDPSDPDAISWRRWYHPTYGIYCPRAYETIQL